MIKKLKNTHKLSITLLVFIMLCGAIVQYSDWLHAQDTAPFKYTFEEKLDELLSISNLSLKIEKSDKITITDVKYLEEILSFNEVNNEFVFVREFEENGKYEFVVSYQEKIEKEVAETATSKEDTILKQAGIEKEPSVEDIPVDKVEEANKNILEKKIVEDWSETKTMAVEYVVKDIHSKDSVSSDKVEPVAPDKIETVDKEPVKPKEEPTEEVIPPVEKEEPAVPKEEIPIEKEEPVVPKEEIPIEKEEPVVPKEEEPIEEVSKSCYEVNNGVIVGLKATNHTGCENKDHLILDIPSIIDEQRITEIGKDAFINHTEIIKVILPDSIIKIGEKAFAGTTSLLHITIMGEIQEIHTTAFEGSSVKEIDISHQYESKLSDSPWGASKEVKVTFKPVPRLTPPPVMSSPKTAVATDQSACFEVSGGTITKFKAIDHDGCTNPEHKDVVIPERINGTLITSIGSNAFFSCGVLTSIILSDNLTSIGYQAFSYCGSLTSITIPNGVTSIGDSAFELCSALTSITLPNTLKSIGNEAFSGCTYLASITLPNTLTSIGNSTFELCSSLTTITIPDSVKKIGSNAFADCNHLNKIDLPTKYYNDITGTPWGARLQVVYWKYNETCFEITSDGQIGAYKPIGHGTCTEDHSIANIPASINDKQVVGIAANAFYNHTSLKSVTLPSSITTIGEKAFYNDISIMSGINRSTITFGSTIMNVASNVFSPYFIGTIKVPDKVEGAIENAPWGANKLAVIEWMASSVPPIVVNDSFVFRDQAIVAYTITDDYLKDIIIPDTYRGEDGLEKDVLYIDPKAFEGAMLNSIQFNSTSKVKEIRDEAFLNCGANVKSIILPNSVKTIGKQAFTGNPGLEVVSLGSGVKSIGESAFSGITSLKILSLNNILETIEPYAFKGCSGLETLLVPDTVTSIGADAFTGCTGLISLIIGKGIIELSGLGISSCTSLVDVSILGDVSTLPVSLLPSDVKKLHFPNKTANSVSGYRDDRYMDVYWKDNGTCFDYDADTGELLRFKPQDHSGCKQGNVHTLADIPESIEGTSITSIASNAFSDSSSSFNYEQELKKLKKIIIPDSVTSIGSKAFHYSIYNASKLAEIYIGNGIEESLPTDLLHNSQNVSIYLPTKPYDTVKNQPWGANVASKVYWESSGTCFYTDGNGTLLKLAPVGHYGVCTHEGHKEITIPDTLDEKTVTIIGDKAFAYSQELVKVTIPDTVTSIGDYAFDHCSFLASINIPINVTSIGKLAFSNCSILKSLTLPDSLTSIGNSAFDHCSFLTSINIPINVASIGSGAFAYCYKLTEITIPDKITYLYSDTFHETPIEKIHIPTKLPGLIDGAPWGSSKGGVTEVYWMEVDTNCYWMDKDGIILGFKPSGHSEGECLQGGNHTKVNIPDKIGTKEVLGIGKNAFSGLSNISEVTLSNTITTIADSAFSNCSLVSAILLPPSLNTLGKNAFSGCNGLLEITIPNSVTSIGDGAFWACNSLHTAKLSNRLTNISRSLFNDCTSLTQIEIPDMVTVINYYAFQRCTALVSVTLPSNLSRIDALAFDTCSALTSINFPSHLGIGKQAFRSCRSLANINFPSNLSIGENAFEACDGLTRIDLQEDTRIGRGSFSGCVSVTEITLEKNVTTNEFGAFSYCYNLEKVTVKGDINLVYRAFNRAVALKEFILEMDTVPNLQLNIFGNVTPVKTIRFPNLSCKDFSSINEFPFGSKVKNPVFYFKSNGSYFDSDANGTFYAKPNDHEDMLTLDKMETLTNLTIPEKIDGVTVKKLANSLKDFTNVFEIYYNGTELTTTENNYFNIPSLRRLTFNKEINSFSSPDGTEGPLFDSSITDIYFNENVFGSISDTSIKDGRSYTNWGKGGEMRTHFKDDPNDTECFYVNNTGETMIGLKPINHDDCKQGNDHSILVIPESITIIGDYAFNSYGTNGTFEAVVLPETITEIGAHAFEGSTKLKGIDLPNSVVEIKDSAFAYSSLESITFGRDLVTIGTRILDQVTLKEAITLDQNVNVVPDTAFSGLTMDLIDWDGAPTNALIQINQIQNDCSFRGAAPWGMTPDPDIKYKADLVFLETDVTYIDNNTKANINYVATPEEGGTVNTIKKPDGDTFNPAVGPNAVYNGVIPATLNSKEYKGGKGYELSAKSAAGRVVRRMPIVNRIVYMTITANKFDYYDFKVDELDIPSIMNLSNAKALLASNQSPLDIEVLTSIEDIKTALISEGGEVYVDIQARCRLDGMDQDYVKKATFKITAKYGNVTADNRIMTQTEAKSFINRDEFKTLLNTRTTTTEGANDKLYTTIEDEEWERFVNGEVGEYTVTSHLGRVTHESKVKVVKDGSTISLDKQSSVYGHDVDLGLTGVSKYTVAQLLRKIKPEYEQPGTGTVTDISAFNISPEDIAKLQTVGIDGQVTIAITYTSTGLADDVTVTIVDDSPDTLVEIPQEVVLDKNGVDVAATGEGTIKLVADKEHLSDLNIDIKVDDQIKIKYIKDLSKFANVDVYKSNSVKHDGINPLMTLNSLATKEDTFKLILSKENGANIPLGLFEGKMIFTIDFR